MKENNASRPALDFGSTSEAFILTQRSIQRADNCNTDVAASNISAVKSSFFYADEDLYYPAHSNHYDGHGIHVNEAKSRASYDELEEFSYFLPIWNAAAGRLGIAAAMRARLTQDSAKLWSGGSRSNS